MAKSAPKRTPAQEQDTPEATQDKQAARDHDQGIRRDQRGQDQPKDNDRAQS